MLPYRGKLAVVLLLSLAGTVVALALPYLTKLLVDEALLGRNLQALAAVVGLSLLLTILNFFINYSSGLRYTAVSAAVLFDMRLALYRHLQRLSPRFYASTPLGEIVSRINNDIGEIQRVVSETALSWLGHVLFLAGAVAVMVTLDARLFLVGLVFLPFSLLALTRYRQRLEGSIQELRARSAEIGSFLIETLQAGRLIVSANAQEREATRFRDRNDAFVSALMRMQKLRYLSGGLPGLLVAGGTALVFLYGGARVISGETSLGTFVAFMAYQMRLIGPIQGLMGLYANVATVRVSLGRVHEVLRTPVEVRERRDAVRLERARGELALEHVRFTFGRGSAVLDGVNLRIAPGERVAILGLSGSGKSTVADLLVRHLDPDSGRILLDGIDLRDVRLADLRRQVVIVDQEPFLFHASLGENIRYSAPAAPDSEVLRAAEDAGLEELLANLPEGLATIVGERGRTLSVGERQRVALARALLTRPAVLVLDEPTAALDPVSEARAIRGYERSLDGVTTIMITHSFELARKADRAVVLHDGRIVADGPADELSDRAGGFRRLFASPAPDGSPPPSPILRVP